MKDRSKQLSKTTWKDPTRSLSRLAKVESKLVALFRNYRKRVLAELKPADQPFTQMEQHQQGGEGSGNFGHAGRPGEVGGSGPGGTPSENVVKAIKHYSALGGADASRYPATVEQTHEMHQWLENGTIEGPVWRGEGYSEEEFDKLFDSKVEVGGEFQSNHPLSFTRDEMRKGAYGPGDYKIYYRLEGKATGRDISDWSIYKEEKEVLIAPNTRFKIVSRESKSEGHRWYVTIKPVEDPHTQKAPQWPASFSIEHFYQRLEDLTTQELIGPANAILEKEIPDAFTHGTKYADLNLKAKMGIKLGAPLEERQRAWKKIGALVEGSKGEFKGVSDAVNQQIRRVISDGMVNEDSFKTVTKAIQDVTADVGEVRARTIARTETMKAVNVGVRDRYEKVGVDRLERIEAEDERTCLTHEFVIGDRVYYGCSEIDGEIFTLEEAAQIDAQTHPNCRGSWIISEKSLGLSEEEATQKYRQIVQGGEGSGNFGHAGRPGEVGGSGPGGEHPAITKGYVKRGETYTDQSGTKRIVFTEPRESGKDFELHVPVEKEKEYLDDVVKFQTEREAQRAEWERERVKEETRIRKIQERKLETYRSMPALTTPRIEEMDRDKLDVLKKEIKRDFKEGIHESWASDAAEGLAIHPEATGKVIRDREGKLHGVVTYTLDPKSQDVYIHDLASSGKVRGAGKSLMREVAKEAAAAGKGIVLQSYEAPDTLEFYERLKMHPVRAGLREHLYRFTPEETKKFGETGVANKIEIFNPITQKNDEEQITCGQGRFL